MKQLIWICLCWLTLLLVDAQAADGALPPEVKVLIGMKIPPKAPGRQGDVPGWLDLDGQGIVNSIGFSILQKDKVTILAIDSVDPKDQTRTILDVRMIPGNLLNRYMKDGQVQLKTNDMQLYRITTACLRGGSPDEDGVLMGMWRYEPGTRSCGGPSNLIKKAWLLNSESGKLTDISTEGVTCREIFTCGED
jgi:hypothetical protein